MLLQHLELTSTSLAFYQYGLHVGVTAMISRIACLLQRLDGDFLLDGVSRTRVVYAPLHTSTYHGKVGDANKQVSTASTEIKGAAAAIVVSFYLRE